MEEDSLFHWLIQRWLETCFSTFIWLVVSGGLGRESNILVPTWRQMTIDSWQFLLIWKWIKTLRYFLSTIRGGEYNNCMPQMVKLFAFADRNMKWTNWKWHLIAIIKSSFALLLILQVKALKIFFFIFTMNYDWSVPFSKDLVWRLVSVVFFHNFSHHHF